MADSGEMESVRNLRLSEIGKFCSDFSVILCLVNFDFLGILVMILLG